MSRPCMKELTTRANISDELVDRFLSWPLPTSVCSDPCASTPGYPHQRVGTNLLTADEARQMLQHVVGPLLNAKQAVIDRLMLEHCPEEMTEAQVREWGEHQKPAGPEAKAQIEAALRTPSESGRNAIIEECAVVCDETARLQSEMAEGEMTQYRKARAWDASICAAKIRALKNAAPQAGMPSAPDGQVGTPRAPSLPPAVAAPSSPHSAERATSRVLIESLCEAAIGLNAGWSRVNAEWLRDLALKALPSSARFINVDALGKARTSIEDRRDRWDERSSEYAELTDALDICDQVLAEARAGTQSARGFFDTDIYWLKRAAGVILERAADPEAAEALEAIANRADRSGESR